MQAKSLLSIFNGYKNVKLFRPFKLEREMVGYFNEQQMGNERDNSKSTRQAIHIHCDICTSEWE